MFDMLLQKVEFVWQAGVSRSFSGITGRNSKLRISDPLAESISPIPGITTDSCVLSAHFPRSARYRPEIQTPLKQLLNTFIHCLFWQQVRQLLANKIH